MRNMEARMIMEERIEPPSFSSASIAIAGKSLYPLRLDTVENRRFN